jgi:hypothetical protein
MLQPTARASHPRSLPTWVVVACSTCCCRCCSSTHDDIFVSISRPLQLDGGKGKGMTAVFNNDIGASLFLKVEVRRRNCTWSTCDGKGGPGVACVGASAAACMQDNSGVYRCNACRVTRRTSHVTRHTSHVTRHTSHVTRHTSHVTRHTTSHVTLHTTRSTRSGAGSYSSSHGALPPPIVFGLSSSSQVKHVRRHTSHVARHTSHVSVVTRHTSHVTRHTSHVTRYS